MIDEQMPCAEKDGALALLAEIAALKRYDLHKHPSGVNRSHITINVKRGLFERIDAALAKKEGA